jgi:hypothetical protein
MYKVLIPSGVDLDLSVTAGGFNDWSYGASSKDGALHLEPGETIVLNIKLQPITNHPE